MIYALAAIYVLAFWGLGSRWPEFVLGAIFAVAPFQQDISVGGPFRFSLAELNLLLALPLLIFGGRSLRLGPVFAPALAYLTVCGLSSALHWRDSATVCFLQMILYLVCMVAVFATLPRSAESLRRVANGLLLVAVFLVAMMFVQRTNYVLGLHKNGVGASLCCALVVNAELWFAETRPRWKYVYAGALAIIATGLILSLSRGAWMGSLVGVLTLVILRKQYGLVLKLSLVLVPIVAWIWFSLPQASREYAADLKKDAYNVNARLESVDYAWSLFREAPALGLGVGLRKEYDATNVVLSTMAETGVVGLVTFLSIFAAHFFFVRRTVKWIPVSMFEFSLVSLSLALVAAKLAHGLVDHFWGRGTMTLVTASVGMAAYAAFSAKVRLLQFWTQYTAQQSAKPAAATSVAA